ncbi:unnamed protein product [Bursaphelenchus okinawaensis]|uniref:cystathionine beta-synthase n=1 Tax=Bursaphelenchus okinawaensis TaxID=465554 RepID=A0A811KVY2_9BILA|nr:unnamed protein product [Bursaphelenchus okinawaensis]CAG9112812.1 unnamed protein product [Bursaphelenchus okinawaensis]
MAIPEGKMEWKEDHVVDDRGSHKFRDVAPPTKRICESVLDTIGRTPTVRLQKIAKEYGLECELYAKCEFLSGGGTTKDRVSLRMIQLAEESGQLNEGTTIIEPSTGNTAISTALALAPRGYKMITVMPDDECKSREDMLKCLGSDIVKVGNDVSPDSPEGFVGKAYELAKTIPNSIVLWPHRDCANPLAHYENTAPGIIRALGNSVDKVVISLNSGGTAVGVSKRLKKEIPNVKIVAAKVEPGYSVDLLSSISYAEAVDETVTVEKAASIKLMQDLHRLEGILCGQKGGVVMAAALKAAKPLKQGQKCLLILPEGLTHFSQTNVNSNTVVVPPPDGSVAEPSKPPVNEWQKIPVPWNATRVAKKVLCDSILDAIGNTPLIKLKKIPKKDGINAELLVKCEYMNPGGSIKDRTALKMVEMAEKQGILKPGMTIIEPSAGNMGISLALVAAVKGYKCINVITDKQSKEKELVMKSLGASVVTTPWDVPYTDESSNHSVALRIQKATPDSVILDHYRNDANPFSHYEGIGIELFENCEEQIDAIVIGAGTGGTLTGVAKRIREDLPNCMIYGVDPVGSVLAELAPRGQYLVEGIGQDFIPAVMKNKMIDGWITVKDNDAFIMARRLMKEEGLLAGGSSGANVWAALSVAKTLGPDSRVVTILPDGIRNATTHFIDDNWMKEKGFAV